MYRYVRKVPLETGQKYGDIVRDGDLKKSTIEKMLLSGTLVEIVTPPLSQIPGWDKRSSSLEKVGVVTLDDLIKYDGDELARLIKRPARIIKEWQDECLTLLRPTPQKTGCGCK